MLPRCPRCLRLPLLLASLVLLPLPLAQAADPDAQADPDTQTAPDAQSAPDAQTQQAAPPASSTPPPDPQRQRELLAQRSQLEARIESLQEQGARADGGLEEARLALGSVLQELGEPLDASAVYDAAWQARRVDAGLEDPAQLPILQQLFASQRDAQQWEDADATAHLIHHIASRAHAPGSAQRLEAVLLLGRWKLLAARDELLPNAFATAFQATDLYRAELAALQQAGDAADRIQLATLYLEKASAAYLLARTIDEQPLQEYYLGGQRTTTMVQCQVVRMADGSSQRLCMPVEVPNVDFYVDPSNRKQQDIGRFLGAMRADMGEAFTQLSGETGRAAERDRLLQDLQGLTALYNGFTGRHIQTP